MVLSKFLACVLTDRFSHDDQQVKALLGQIDDSIDHFSGDGAYDEAPVYDAVIAHSPNADVVIPPRSTAVESNKSAPGRNQNIAEIKAMGSAYSTERARRFYWGSFQEGTKFPSTPLQPFASLGCSQ